MGISDSKVLPRICKIAQSLQFPNHIAHILAFNLFYHARKHSIEREPVVFYFSTMLPMYMNANTSFSNRQYTDIASY